MRRKFFVVLLLIVLMLSGCTYVVYDNPAEGKALNQYILKDLVYYENFSEYINNIYEDNIKQVLKVEHTKTRLFGESEITYLTAIIIEQPQNNNFVYAIMPLIPIDSSPNVTTKVKVFDYTNQSYNADIMKFSEELEIMLIRFQTISTNFSIAKTHSINFPLEGQITAIIGSKNKTINSVELGIIKEADENNFIYIDAKTDIYGNGSMVLNINYEWIGMQINFNNNLIKVIPSNLIIDWLNE